MEKKPLLIFDFFGVVVEEVAHKWLHDRMSVIKARPIIDSLFVKVDQGIITPTDCFNELQKLTGVPASQIEEDWYEIGQLRKDTYTFLKENQTNYHIVLLSNAGSSFINKFFVTYPLQDLFLKRFISAELKLAKPDPAVFNYVLSNTGVPYSYAVMIDDGPKNIEAARNIGIEGIIFKDMAQTAQELAKIAKKHQK